MKARLLSFLEDVRDSYWIVPALMALGAMIGAHFLLEFDRGNGADWARNQSFIWSGGSEGARGVLGTIAGSVITVAGVVFSTTITSLTLASSQFGPRLLRNFVRDRANQFVLGVFTATFLFCILVLRSIRSADENFFVPYLCVTVALGLAVGSIGTLIFFIHHVADSIQIENVVARTAREWIRVIERNRPEKIAADKPQKSPEENGVLPPDFERNAAPLRAARSGYIQAVDYESLVETARRAGGVLRLEKGVGDFVARGETWALGWPANRWQDGDLARSVALGHHRNPTQDVLYPLQQLVEIALVALSPGVNVQFTAQTCIDWIGVGLGEAARRDEEKTLFFDENHDLRLQIRAVSFGDLCDHAFDAIRQSGAGNGATVVRLLQTLEKLSACVEDEAQREILRRHARQIGEAARAQNPTREDEAEFEAHLRKMESFKSLD